jgi:lysozyme
MSYNRILLESELVRDEGERLKVYRCTAGKRTIGVGRNLDDVGIAPAESALLGITVADAMARGVTRAQSRGLLSSDIDRCERDLDRKLPWWRRLGDVRQRVLLNMCFNLGITRLLGFRDTLAAIERGDYAAAAAGMADSAWHRQVGKRALRLEAMMRTGRVA